MLQSSLNDAKSQMRNKLEIGGAWKLEGAAGSHAGDFG